MFMKSDRIILLVGVIIFTAFGACCADSHDTLVQPLNADRTTDLQTSSKKPAPNTVKSPTGNEMEESVTIVGPKKAVLNIRNKSDAAIFVPYLRGKNGYAYFMNYELELKNEETGEWETFPPSDMGSGFHPLESGELIKVRVAVPRRGTYRVGITYIVDRHLYERLEEISKIGDVGERLAEYEKLDEEFDLSKKKIRSEPFRL